MVELRLRYKQLVIKGTATPIFVPPTLAIPASGELAIVLAEPVRAERKGELVKIETAISETMAALGLTYDAARKRIYRAVRHGRLTDLGKKGPNNAVRGDLFYRWLRHEKEQMGEESEVADRQEIEDRIRQARAEKRRHREN